MTNILRGKGAFRHCLLCACFIACVLFFVSISSSHDRGVVIEVSERETSVTRRKLLEPLTKWLADAEKSRQQKVPLSHWVQEATIAASDMLNASSVKSKSYDDFSKQLRHTSTNLNESLLTIANEVGTELEKSFVMNEALKDFGYRSALTLNRPDTACLTKKRIVVDVNRCGLGNRILAVFSSIMLAVLTNRVLEIVWEANKYCGSSYDELFTPKEQSEWIMKPLVYNNSKLVYDNIRSEFACHVRLDQSEWGHFYFLKDRELFDRMNTNCDVIFLITNQLFHELLLDHSLFGNDADRLQRTFPYPFSNVSQIAFRPKPSIALQAELFYRQYLAGRKVLSIHSRGFYDSGKGLKKVFNCVNKLVAEGVVDTVFFASESAKLNKYIYDLAANGTNVVRYQKIEVQDQIGNVDSQSIRNDMSSAMVEWYLLGEAQYCMSSTIVRSTFSLTAMLRGNCKYIPHEKGDSCDVYKEGRGPMSNKEDLLGKSSGRGIDTHISELPQIDDKKRERVWQKVHKLPQLTNEQCYDVDKQPFDSVLSYWQ